MKFTLKNVIAVAVGFAILYGIYVAMRPLTQGFSGQDTFTLYYADWCPHCKAVKPAFESWMGTQKLVTAQMYEADKNAAEVQAANVKGFPTLVLKKADGTTKECSARDADGWNAFLKANM
jgi:thiol-disulfide isomerase/thioredoxin